MTGKRGGGEPEGAGFVRTLGALKQQGSNVLLVGTAAADAHGDLCHRLLGETGGGSRYRLVVTDDRDRGAALRDDPSIRRIDYSTLDLAGSNESELSDRTPLGTLGIEIIESVDALDDAADGLEPSELRLCVDSLVPLLEEHTAEKVFRLLHLTTSRVVHVQGMGHYHLPLERDHDAVRLFEPMFDAVVEVRDGHDGPEQRWELRDGDSATEWLPL